MKTFLAPFFLLLFCPAPLPALGMLRPPQIDPCEIYGRWEGFYEHQIGVGDFPQNPLNPQDPDWTTFNPIHAAMVVKGPNRGWILVWDNSSQTPPPPSQTIWYQRWALIDPDNLAVQAGFVNRELTMPPDEGDLYCAGFSLTSKGNVFVAGGNTKYGTPNEGGRLTYVYYPPDPIFYPNGLWDPQPNLDDYRWYPTVILQPLGGTYPKDRMLVLGGKDVNAVSLNTYQSFIPSQIQGIPGNWQVDVDSDEVFAGPQSPATLDVYPRMIPLGIGEVAWVGQSMKVGTLIHDPRSPALVQPKWDDWPADLTYRHTHGSAALEVIQLTSPVSNDKVYTLGGKMGGVVLDKVESYWFDPNSPSPWWTTENSLINHRTNQNLVVYPDGSLYVMGGNYSGPAFPIPNPRHAERFKNGIWTEMNPSQRTHGQHSIAILVPNGNILVGGSEGGVDQQNAMLNKAYEVFIPPNISCGPGFPRPQITSPNPSDTDEYLEMIYDGTGYAISYNFSPNDGSVVDRVVLVRPGAVTHAWDADQRVIELEITNHNLGVSIEVRAPTASELNLVPPGYFMLFLVTNKGVPCERAAWATVQW